MPNSPGSGLPNPAAYTDLGNGTVRDNVTCLVWQRQPSPVEYTFAGAQAYCASLDLGGGGWHLPSRVELTSIVDVGRVGPAIDPAAFPRTPARFFWTSTPWALAHTPPFAWIINFYEGLASNAGNQSGEYWARCVRSPGGSGGPTYRVLSAEQVEDPYTGLIWQRSTSPTTMSAAAAAGYCRGLTVGGQQWRLPSVKELATTVDESDVAPAIDEAAFPRTAKSTWYWSSSVAKADATSTWALNYDDGFTNYRNITAGYVRCVR
ncbi:MAG TPA: DUF1566 domain-containing protein [Micromonosporaceae bacterium]|nr:DUF1566 domain-containing protein [Micromonosporaceae bacterium]